MALQLSSVSSQKCIHPCCLSFLSLTPQTSRQSCLWSILPTLWLPLWSRLPSCLPWLIAVASDLVSLLLHCSPTISSLVKRSQWCLKTLPSVLLCSECPHDFMPLLEQNQGPYSGLEACADLFCDFCWLWVLLSLSVISLCWSCFCSLKCQMHSDLRAHNVPISGTLFPKGPT